jgi:hypothetical protein
LPGVLTDVANELRDKGAQDQLAVSEIGAISGIKREKHCFVDRFFQDVVPLPMGAASGVQ